MKRKNINWWFWDTLTYLIYKLVANLIKMFIISLRIVVSLFMLHSVPWSWFTVWVYFDVVTDAFIGIFNNKLISTYLFENSFRIKTVRPI